VSLPIVGYTEDGKPIYGEESPKPAKLKRCVVRNLGRVEQIIACAERLLDRTETVSAQPATKNA
jgi:hypothetical protein